MQENVTPDAEPAAGQLDLVVQLEAERRCREGLCFECGTPGAQKVSFMRVTSFLVMTSHKRWETFLCPPCTERTGIKEQTISALLGWWGFPWGLLTLGALVVNTRSLLKSTTFGRVAAVMFLVGVVGLPVALVSSLPERGASEEVSESEAVGPVAGRLYDEAVRLFEEGRTTEGFDRLQRAHRSDPSSWIIRLGLAQALIGRGEHREALRHLDGVRRTNPRNQDAIELAAIACRHLGEFDRALRSWHDLAALDDSVRVHGLLQDAARRAGTIRDLIPVYDDRYRRDASGENRFLCARLVEDPSDRADGLREALVLVPDLDVARIELVSALIEARCAEEAASALAQLEPTARDPDGLLLRVRLAVLEREPESAALWLDGLLSALPDHASFGALRSGLLLHRADVRSLLNRFSDARADLAAAGALLGHPVWFALREINSHVSEGSLEVARAALVDLEARRDEFDPDDRAFFALTRGRIAWEEGRIDEAIDELTLEADAGCRRDLRARAATLCALCDLEQGRTADAQGRFVAASACELPGTFIPETLTSRLFLGQLEPDAYLKAVARGPVTYDNDAWFSLGLFHEHGGRLDEARHSYARAVESSIGNDFPVALARRKVAELK